MRTLLAVLLPGAAALAAPALAQSAPPDPASVTVPDVALPADPAARAKVLEDGYKFYYFHNGAVSDLAEAVRIMAVTQTGRVLSEAAALEPVIEWSSESRRLVRITPTPLSERDVADIVAFLKTLTGEQPKLTMPILPPSSDKTPRPEPFAKK